MHREIESFLTDNTLPLYYKYHCVNPVDCGHHSRFDYKLRRKINSFNTRSCSTYSFHVLLTRKTHRIFDDESISLFFAVLLDSRPFSLPSKTTCSGRTYKIYRASDPTESRVISF